MRKDWELKRINVDRENLSLLFPEKILPELSDVPYFVYGALKKGKVKGACVFTLFEALPKTVQLHYVTVEKECREGGIGSALIRKGIESMKQAGVKTVLFREMSESAAGLLASFRFASANGFLPLCDSETLFTYDTMQLMENSHIMKLAKGKKPVGDQALRRTDTGEFIMDAEPAGDDLTDYMKRMSARLFAAVQDPSLETLTIQAAGEERIRKLRDTLGEPQSEIVILEMAYYI